MRTFLTSHQADILDKTRLAVVVEHIGKSFIPQGGVLVPTGLSEPLSVYVSKSSTQFGGATLGQLACNAVLGHQLSRKMVLDGARWHTGGESSSFEQRGIPALGLISGPHYLLLESDTLDKVDVEQLQPTVRALAEVIHHAATP
jgi:hypothetical protein